MIAMNKNQIDIVAHSLGINYYNAKLSECKKDKELPIEFYRNRYNYGEFTNDMQELETAGIIQKYDKLGCTMFFVTELGITKFRDIFKAEVTDKYVPLSKSKQKYFS